MQYVLVTLKNGGIHLKYLQISPSLYPLLTCFTTLTLFVTYYYLCDISKL